MTASLYPCSLSFSTHLAAAPAGTLQRHNARHKPSIWRASVLCMQSFGAPSILPNTNLLPCKVQESDACTEFTGVTSSHPASRPPAVWGSNRRGHTGRLAAASALLTRAAALRFCGSSELAMPAAAQSSAPSSSGTAGAVSFTLTCDAQEVHLRQ